MPGQIQSSFWVPDELWLRRLYSILHALSSMGIMLVSTKKVVKALPIKSTVHLSLLSTHVPSFFLVICLDCKLGRLVCLLASFRATVEHKYWALCCCINFIPCKMKFSLEIKLAGYFRLGCNSWNVAKNSKLWHLNGLLGRGGFHYLGSWVLPWTCQASKQAQHPLDICKCDQAGWHLMRGCLRAQHYLNNSGKVTTSFAWCLVKDIGQSWGLQHTVCHAGQLEKITSLCALGMGGIMDRLAQGDNKHMRRETHSTMPMHSISLGRGQVKRSSNRSLAYNTGNQIC